LSEFKEYHPSWNLKLNYFGILQSLKLLLLMGKNPFYFSSAEFHSKYFGLLWVKVDILKRQAGIYGVWHVHGGAARLLGAARRHQ